MTTTPTQDKATARVSGYAHGGTVTIDASVGVPTPPDIQAKADAIGLPSIRPAVLDASRKLSAVGHYLTLKKQIDAANKAVADAKEVERRVQAAKVLLEGKPEDDLAEKLRKVTGEIAAAAAARAQAERDLLQIEHLLPKHFAAAASAITSHADLTAMQHVLSQGREQKAAESEFAEACARVEAVLRAAVEEFIAPAAEKLLALNRAADVSKVSPFAEGVREQVLGPTPEGVRRHQGTRLFEVVAPPAPQPEKQPEPAKPMNEPMLVLTNPSGRELLERRKI